MNRERIVEQFNGGICDRCGGQLAESPYVGGDHDEIAECRSCGKHYGCWECERATRPSLGTLGGTLTKGRSQSDSS